MASDSVINEEKLFETYKRILLTLSTKEYVLKGRSAADGTEINIAQVEETLNDARSRTGEFKHRMLWRAHTEWTHPLGKNVTNAWGHTRAYLKMVDILQRFPRLKTGKYAKLRSLHLCESPGNFVAALGDSLYHPLDWKMNSLNPHYEWTSPSSMLIEDALVIRNEDRMFFGENNSGNIFKFKKEDFEKLGKVDLVTGDGSFDCTHDPEGQEKLVGPLIAREAFLAMNALETGGNLVLKMFTFFLPETRDILQRIVGSFEEVYLRKPAPSKPGNSEVYVVAMGFLGEMIKDENPAILTQLDAAGIFFAEKQIEMILFNLDTLSISQFLKCQIEEAKQLFVSRFMDQVPAAKFWEIFASKKPFFPISYGPVDPTKLQLAASPFVNDSWLRQRKILAIPFDDLPESKEVLNPLLALYDENFPMFDFCQIQKPNFHEDQLPPALESATFLLTPWILPKTELISQLMLVLSDANRIVVKPADDTLCGILSRFSISVMAVLLDSFEVDGIPRPGSAILLKRKRPLSPIVIQFLNDVLRQQRISEVLCFVPLNDLSQNFRSLFKFYNGFNNYY